MFGGSVQMMQLVDVLGGLNSELVVLVGDDGCLYLAHRFTPELFHAKIDLKTDPPTVTELASFGPSSVYEKWLDRAE